MMNVRISLVMAMRGQEKGTNEALSDLDLQKQVLGHKEQFLSRERL